MRRRHAVLGALLGLLALLAGLGWLGGWGRRPGPPPAGPVEAPPPVAVAPRAEPSGEPAAAPEPGLDRIRVLSVEGEVQRRSSSGGWSAVQAGEELQEDEAIRTRSTGRAVLGLGASGRVEIAPRSEFSLREISRTVAHVRLEQGRLSAAMPEGSGRLRVETRDSGAHAESTGGEFVVVSPGEGQLTVAATRGEVRLSVGAQSVVVHAGEQSEAQPGTAPSAPHVIPRSLYLKVGRPGATVQREKETVVRGQTVPGAIVSVNGLRVPASATGAFEVSVPLQDGRNALVVEAEDVFGARKQLALPPVTVKSQVRAVRARVTWSGAEGGGG